MAGPVSRREPPGCEGDKPLLVWGLYPFLWGDAVKLALATALMPLIWRLVGRAARNGKR